MAVSPLQKRVIVQEPPHSGRTYPDGNRKFYRIRLSRDVRAEIDRPSEKSKSFIPSETPEIETTEKTEAEPEENPEHPILCAACGTIISYREHILRYAGSSEHIFTNPHGFVFRVGLFREAPGVFTVGDWTEEFSWFTGFAWRFAVCGGCMTHLGWEYSGEPGGTTGKAGRFGGPGEAGELGGPAGEPAAGGRGFSRFYGLVVTKLTGWD